MHKSRKLRIERERVRFQRGNLPPGYYGKTPVMGIFDRETRRVRAKVVPNVKRETLHRRRFWKNIEHGSAIYTDEGPYSAYHNLREKFVHETVNHLSAYVRGQVHTNCLEIFWSLTKRTLKGTYVCVEPFHLDRYIDEQVFRFNNRATKDNPLNDADRFLLALSQVANKRLTYAELTGKSGATTPF